MTLNQAYSQLDEFGLEQDDVPLIIQLVENPKFDLPGIDIFHGATNLETHDYIHILLGRGVMIKDEAFVLGFTMGSSNRVTTTEERLFSFITKYVYPKDYRFTDEDLHIFKDAVRLGFVSDCQSLAKVDYKKYLDWPLQKSVRTSASRSTCSRPTTRSRPGAILTSRNATATSSVLKSNWPLSSACSLG